MTSQEEFYDESDIIDQEIGMSARLGNPDIPDVQEPEPDPPQPRIRQFYTATRVLSLLLVVGSLLSGWISYGLMPDGKFLNKECDKNLEVWKKRFMILQVIGTLIALAQLVNIGYQLKANGFDMYKVEEPLNYVDGRTEVLFVLLLVFVPQMSIMTELDSKCRLNTTSTNVQYCGNESVFEKIRNSADVNARIAYAILGFLSIHSRFIFSRALVRFRKKGVADEFQAYKLKKTKLLKIILFLDKQLPRILKFVGLDFICICRKIKIPVPCLLGYCIMDHCTPVWRWMYCVLECWVGRLTICPKKERGEVWYVNRIRGCRRRPGFLCINKGDPFWLGEYTMFFYGLAIPLFLNYLRIYFCFIPGTGKKELNGFIEYLNMAVAYVIPK